MKRPKEHPVQRGLDKVVRTFRLEKAMRTYRHLIALIAAAMVLTSIATNAQSNGTATVCLPTTQPPQHTQDITRNSLYWFTHGYSNDLMCVTLQQAIIANGGTLNIGFVCLP